MSEKTNVFLENLKNSFVGRWIVKYRISFLVIILILVYGMIVAINIPKESSPDIKFGVVQITTVYPGANPIDIDDSITKKIEDEIKGVDGIDKISSKSVLGLSLVTITLKNDVDTKNFINDIKNKIDNLTFPDDVKKSQITELSSSDQIMFQMILYGPQSRFTMNQIRTNAMKFKDLIKDQGGIVDVKINGLGSDSDYDILVKLNKQKVESYGLAVGGVLGQIKAYNQNLPLGNHNLDKLSYDYRIDNELRTFDDLKNVPIKVNDTYIKLGDFAEIQREYKNKSITYGGVANSANNYAVSISIYKQKGGNIFEISKNAKAVIAATLKKPQFEGIKSQYTVDLSEYVTDDFGSLGESGAISVALVFIITMLFVGFRQALIATLSMFLSFMLTFMTLQWLGLSMNFMTNFSLILSFGVGIDTVVVFIQAAWENMQKGYNPTTAMLMAVHTYQSANVNTSIINAIVFIPLLTLPGVTGKFLAYIPITIFSTLIATLFLALTVNNALFARFNKKQDYYYADDDDVMILSQEEKEILELERQGKEQKFMTEGSKFESAIKKMSNGYVAILKRVLGSRVLRLVAMIGPIIALIGTFIFLAPVIGFKLFPSGDNPMVTISITAKEGTNTVYLASQASGIDQIISSYPEVKSYIVNINNNVITAAITLVKKGERKKDSFVLQESMLAQLKKYEKLGYRVEGEVQAGGPPSGKAIGIKLVAGDKDQLTALKKVSQDFEIYLKSLKGTINVSNSSTTSPGQFTLNFDKGRLADLGLTPQDLQGEIYGAINGLKAGNITIDKVERDIVLKINTYVDQVTPESVRNLTIITRSGPVTVGQVATLVTNPAITTVNRTDKDIVITVEADLDKGLVPTDFQPKLIEYAEKYQFPAGISYKQSGENEANKDLIAATQRAFLISLFLAFIVLVYQFNSFSKPAIILYSVFTAFLGVNVGLWVTGNPYSMAVAIGIISLLGVVINTAIFLIDRINENMEKGATIEDAIYEAGNTRFKPILITKLTTILGVATSVTQDPFYAGLGYTVIFGLIFAGLITLISIPTLFYVVFKKSKNGGIVGRTKEIYNKVVTRFKKRYRELGD